MIPLKLLPERNRMIKTERLVLRTSTPNDLYSLMKYGNNKNIAKNMRDRFPHPYTNEAGLHFIKLFEKENPQKVFVIEYNGEVIGATGIFPQEDVYHKNAEFGYWIAEPFWNKGLGTEAAKAMIDYGFKTFPIERIYASVFSGNDASKKIMSKLGLKHEATFHHSVFKFGEFRDEDFYVLWRDEWNKN